jgi:hypothetical protein
MVACQKPYDIMDMWLGWQKQESSQNSGTETSWKAATWGTKMEWEDNIKTESRELGYEYGD